MVEERIAYNPRKAKAQKGYTGYFLSRVVEYNIFFDVNGSYYAVKPDGEKDYLIAKNKLKLMLKDDYFSKAGEYVKHFPEEKEQLSNKKVNRMLDAFLQAMTNVAKMKAQGKLEGHIADTMDIPTERL